jgi:hypothetical protein
MTSLSTEASLFLGNSRRLVANGRLVLRQLARAYSPLCCMMLDGMLTLKRGSC